MLNILEVLYVLELLNILEVLKVLELLNILEALSTNHLPNFHNSYLSTPTKSSLFHKHNAIAISPLLLTSSQLAFMHRPSAGP